MAAQRKRQPEVSREVIAGVVHDCHEPTPTRPRYFVTGPFARTPEWSSARNVRWAHAKDVGQSTTLCGLSTLSWTTLWEVPFSARSLQAACPVCRFCAGD